METLSRMMVQGRRGIVGGSPVEFGSEEALDLYIRSVLRDRTPSESDDDIDVLDIYSGIRPDKYIFACDLDSTTSTSSSECDVVVAVTLSSPLASAQSVYETCQKEISQLSSFWTLMKYKDLFHEEAMLRASGRVPDYSDKVMETPSFASTTPSLSSPSREQSLNLDAPNYQPPSKSCGECGNSFLTTNAILSPPGYCEYSGKLICGSCFDGRPQIVPWRLISGCESIRGRVSRRSSRLIHEQLYNPFIHYSDIASRGIHVSQVHALRIRLLTLRPVIGFCKVVFSEVSGLLVSLPLHIREEETPEQALQYSLADLWDIISPQGVSSVIVRTLNQIIQLIESHSACERCAKKFERNCGICSKSVHTTSTEWRFCEQCNWSFHRRCFRYSTDGCPMCASEKRYNIHSYV